MEKIKSVEQFPRVDVQVLLDKLNEIVEWINEHEKREADWLDELNKNVMKGEVFKRTRSGGSMTQNENANI